MSAPLLEMRGIVKRFPGVVALDRVDFTVCGGEIHALMGENGAGKSTLIKVLTGVHGRDDGQVAFRGRRIDPRSPKEAEQVGISTVYQEVNLIPMLSVAENILLGRQPRRWGFLRWRETARRARLALERIGLSGLDVWRTVASCPLAVQQMVAIARALDVDARLLVLDEPTSSLDEAEVEQLFGVLRRLRKDGLGLVFITHFLDQVYAVSDRITVLRNGQLVGEFEAADLTRLGLVEKMLGRKVDEAGKGGIATRGRASSTTPAAPGAAAGADQEGAGPGSKAAVLEVSGLGRRGVVGPVDFSIGRGEAHGLAGLLGSGRTETARLVFGADRPTTGSIDFLGSRLDETGSPRASIARGMAFCSEDRKSDGIVPTLSVRENLILAMQSARGILRLIPRAEQEALAERFIERLGIRTPSPEASIETLSGGNQQKVLLARWLCLDPALLILDEPTRGIDVGTKAEIEKLVAELCARGMSVLFISSEVDEIVRTCSRVSVLRDRRKVGEVSGDAVTEDRIMRLIAEPERKEAHPA
ncbi:MAG TPA: sugar ABC transporter ATP-binding protein [Longimicrobiaceae bacterium]|nr:sugar ABC transporter ATP-binding protein [Longimicrobiaceae bacterium]